MLKFFTKLSTEELKNWKLSIDINVFLTIKLICFSNWFGIIFNSFGIRLYLPSSCIIQDGSQNFSGCEMQQEFCDLI